MKKKHKYGLSQACIMHRAIYLGEEVKSHVFLTTALDDGNFHPSAALSVGKEPRTDWNEGCMDTRPGLDIAT
jgi:hypothetical protein